MKILDWPLVLDNRGKAHCVYFAKAFNLVNHDIILAVCCMSIETVLPCWIGV